ncbi:MAG: hypothetical protein HY423_07050 [Candidatus Lambdaproteobacteria bacterium]|nr:hypothetical protein [Candidatus Lambdaproteobacteria bacterium]
MSAVPKLDPEAPRPLPISGSTLTMGHVEAWMRIIRSYLDLHPDHEVEILYDNDPVNDLRSLFRSGAELNLGAFQLQLKTPDGNRKHAAKLYRHLVEGTGPDYERYLHRELFKVQNLF